MTRRYAVIKTKTSNIFGIEDTAADRFIRTDDGYTWEPHLNIGASKRESIDDLARVLNADAEEQAVAALNLEIEGGQPQP